MQGCELRAGATLHAVVSQSSRSHALCMRGGVRPVCLALTSPKAYANVAKRRGVEVARQAGVQRQRPVYKHLLLRAAQYVYWRLLRMQRSMQPGRADACFRPRAASGADTPPAGSVYRLEMRGTPGSRCPRSGRGHRCSCGQANGPQPKAGRLQSGLHEWDWRQAQTALVAPRAPARHPCRARERAGGCSLFGAAASQDKNAAGVGAPGGRTWER
jgi:hypothetical protein